MVKFPPELRYTREHEWARKEEGGQISVGITHFAQEQLGDIVYVSVPDVGAQVTAGEPLGEIESTKSLSDIYGPLSGTVAETNQEVVDTPALINQDPYGEGWLLMIEPSDPSEFDAMLTAEAYESLLAEAERA